MNLILILILILIICHKQMHLVHIKHGLDKSKIGFTSDSVAVIAILIEVSDITCRIVVAHYLYSHFYKLINLIL